MRCEGKTKSNLNENINVNLLLFKSDNSENITIIIASI